jgi:hypothetical protein
MSRSPAPALLVALALAIACCPCRAQSSLDQITIEAEAAADALASGWVSTGDTASLLSGIDFAAAGGVSSQPTIHGLGDDRVRDMAVINLLNRQYENPLGGTWQSALYAPGYMGATFRPLPSAGRSLDIGVTVKF